MKGKENESSDETEKDKSEEKTEDKKEEEKTEEVKETKPEEPTEDKTEEAPKTEEPSEETSEKPTETEKPAEVEKVEEVTTEKKSEESIEKGKKIMKILQWTSVYYLEATTEEKVEGDKTGETEEVAKVEVRTITRVPLWMVENITIPR